MIDIYGDYRVLDTDYSNFAIVYSCMNFFNLFSVDYAWFITREKTVSQDLINQMRSRLSELHPDYSPNNFYFVKQGGKCQYADL